MEVATGDGTSHRIHKPPRSHARLPSSLVRSANGATGTDIVRPSRFCPTGHADLLKVPPRVGETSRLRWSCSTYRVATNWIGYVIVVERGGGGDAPPVDVTSTINRATASITHSLRSATAQAAKDMLHTGPPAPRRRPKATIFYPWLCPCKYSTRSEHPRHFG